MAWNGSEMRCPKCNKYLPDRCTCNGPSIEQQRNEAGATPPSPSTAEVDDLLGRYWEIAYSEGKSGEPRGSEAQEVLSSLHAALASRPAVEARRPRVALDPELKAALDEAAKTRATGVILPDGTAAFINYGDQPEDAADLSCTACGGSGHIEDQQVIARAALATKPATSAPGATSQKGGE